MPTDDGAALVAVADADVDVDVVPVAGSIARFGRFERRRSGASVV